jgi:hypothetical protein
MEARAQLQECKSKTAIQGEMLDTQLVRELYKRVRAVYLSYTKEGK